MRPVLQLIGVLIAIAGLLALFALAFYVVWRIVMVLVSVLPIIGKKHKHAEWERLQKLSTLKDNGVPSSDD